MKYCKTTTQSHPIAVTYIDSLVDFNALIIDEGYNGVALFKNDEVVINLDKAEALLAIAENNREKNKSMDSAFCVTKNDRKQVVMVEYKFRVENPNNLIREDLVGKVEGSLSVINKNNIYDDIFYEYYFVFYSEIVDEAFSRLRRIYPEIDKQKYIAVDIHAIKIKFFDLTYY